jgi:dinuclear metal center YbgI/SA1388 family protein
MDIKVLIRELEGIAPPEFAEGFDEGKIGLIIEGRREIGRIACGVDATPDVVQQAAALGADLLVVHHTPIFDPVTSLVGYQAEVLRALFSHEMNLYVMHTNYDRVPEGINGALADLLGLQRIREMTLGVVGDCTLGLSEMVRRIGGNVRVYGQMKEIRSLAVVGGAGFDPLLMREALGLGADAFLSSELKHHVALQAPIPCIESTHYALEAPGMQRLARRMNWEFIDAPLEVHTYV